MSQKPEQGFNTASGKYYCNASQSMLTFFTSFIVSIPQAVSTIAIETIRAMAKLFLLWFQYRKR